MNKRPKLISFLAYISIFIGIFSILGYMFYNKNGNDIGNKNEMISMGIVLLYSIIYISSGYFILKNQMLGWQLGLFNQLLHVTKCYGVLIYIFINISKINFGTNDIGDYLIKYATCALIEMGIVYYFLNMKTMNFFKIDRPVRVKTLKLSILSSIIIIMIQIATHTISL